MRDKRRRSRETGSGSTATCSLHRRPPRLVMVPMRGLLIVNDAPPPMAPEWHPESDEFRLVEAALSLQHTSRMGPMAPTVGPLNVTSSREQLLYLDFLPGVCGAGDENRTRVLSLGSWSTRISANYSDVLWLVDKLYVPWQTTPHVSVRAMDAR